MSDSTVVRDNHRGHRVRWPVLRPGGTGLSIDGRLAAVIAIGTALLTLVGCAAQSPSSRAASESGPTAPVTEGSGTLAPTRSPSGAPLTFVVFGDSWVAGAHCGCTTFAGLWAEDVGNQTGRPVHVTNYAGANERSAAQAKTTASLLSALEGDPQTIVTVGTADIVLISTGSNDLGPAFAAIGRGTCSEKNRYSCVRKVGQRWRQDYAAIVRRIVELRKGEPTAIRLVTGGNPFLGDGGLRVTVPADAVQPGGAVIAEAAVAATCGAAEKYGAVCIDGRPILTGPQFDQTYNENAPETFRALADALNDKGLPELAR